MRIPSAGSGCLSRFSTLSLGFTAAALPPGATAEQMAAHFDFDGDGITNFEEWVFKSDPADKNSVPGSPKVNMVNVAPDELLPGPVTFDSIPETGSQSALEYKVAKLTNPVPKLKYADRIQHGHEHLAGDLSQ